jgi:hypothetical protein
VKILKPGSSILNRISGRTKKLFNAKSRLMPAFFSLCFLIL